MYVSGSVMMPLTGPPCAEISGAASSRVKSLTLLDSSCQHFPLCLHVDVRHMLHACLHLSLPRLHYCSTPSALAEKERRTHRRRFGPALLVAALLLLLLWLVGMGSLALPSFCRRT